MYITDFGIARQTTSEAQLTASGQILGTVDYIAPEQLGGAAPAASADVYALACVAFQMLTGTVPYDGPSDVARLWAHVNAQVPRASERRPGVPAAADSVLARGLAKDPAMRADSASSFVDELAAALEGWSAQPEHAATPVVPVESWTLRTATASATRVPD